MKNCCLIKNYNINKCLRNDGKIFNLPRKFTIKECKYKKQKGFSMKSSCAPFKFCKNVKTKKKHFYLIQIILKNHLMFILIKIQKIQLILNIKQLKMLKIQLKIQKNYIKKKYIHIKEYGRLL